MKYLLPMKFVLLWLIACNCYSITYAQKLPKTQNNSLRIPDDIKIDGNATELNNTFQAYNPTTSLYYTIANDDKNLYLAIQAVQPRIVAKILYSGITFTINTLGKKKDGDQGNMVITYPNLAQGDDQSIISKTGIKILSDLRGFTRKPNWQQPETPSDSIVSIANNLIKTKATYIKISGIKAIADSIISIYNTEDIKVAATVNNKQVYTYELIMPLNLLGLPANKVQPFNYELKLLSRSQIGKKYPAISRISLTSYNPDINADLDSTTDFWGEYTLAKNQQ